MDQSKGESDSGPHPTNEEKSLIFSTAESIHTNWYGVVVIGVVVVVSMVNFFSFDVTIGFYPSLDLSG